MLEFGFYLSGQHIYFCNPIYLVAKKFNSHSSIRVVCRENFNDIAMNPECASLKIHIIPGILHIYKTFYDIIPVYLHSRTQ